MKKKQIRKMDALLCVYITMSLLSGCLRATPSNMNQSSLSSSENSSASSSASVSVTPETEPPAQSQTQTATLYVGTKAGGFAEYSLDYEGELTPEIFIQGIADLTGWDLSLGEAVISGKGGMSVCLSEKSSLFTGPPDPQKDEFHMFSADQLAETILDSIQKTLQEGFTGAGGNPDTLDIWYYMEGERPLELPNIGYSWPIDQPYQWADAQN